MSIPNPPAIRLALTEIPRAGAEVARTVVGIRRLVSDNSGGDGHPVLVLPGYGAADGSTKILRSFLKAIGYSTHGMELGRNVETEENRIRSVNDAIRFREKMTATVVDRIGNISDAEGGPVSVIGWSMGGLYAHDASCRIEEKIRQVITLGAPFGDPRGSSLFQLMRKLNKSDVPIEEQDFNGWLKRAHKDSNAFKTSIIYSSRDGIVSDEIARLSGSGAVDYLPIDSSHLGFTSNPQAFETIAGLLKN